MKTCDTCKRSFPNGLVQKFVSIVYVLDLCGICALKAKNEVHGTRFKKFHGENAQRILELTKKYLARKG